MLDKESSKPARPSLKTILVPLDGSVFGEAALPCVEELARISNADVILFQAVTPHHFEIDLAETRSPRLAKLSEEYIEHAAAAAHEYLDRVQKRLSDNGIVARCVVETGPAAEAIVASANKNSVDLIALSTRGRSGLGVLMMGSVANKVLHCAEVPVLLVKPRN